MLLGQTQKGIYKTTALSRIEEKKFKKLNRSRADMKKNEKEKLDEHVSLKICNLNSGKGNFA